MEITPHEFERIESYLRGKLLDKEQSLFEEEMEENEMLFKKVQFQMGVHDFFKKQYAELQIQQELEKISTTSNLPSGNVQRLRELAFKYATLVAMLVIGLGIGWLIFKNQTITTPRLVATKIIGRSIAVPNDNGFGDSPNSIVSQVPLLVYIDDKKAPNIVNYGDTLKLYNPPLAILSSNTLSLSYRNQVLKLQADTSHYVLKINSSGAGTLELLHSNPAHK
jgi:hypothetical protein